jgi:hypothetical protein
VISAGNVPGQKTPSASSSGSPSATPSGKPSKDATNGPDAQTLTDAGLCA